MTFDLDIWHDSSTLTLPRSSSWVKVTGERTVFLFSPKAKLGKPVPVTWKKSRPEL